MINIGYDLRPLQTAHKYRGIGRYCGDLLQALRRRSTGVAFSFLAFEGVSDDIVIKLRPYNNLAEQPHPGDQNRYRYVLKDILFTGNDVASLNADVFHYHLQVAPPRTSVPNVITVHDCIPAWLGHRGTIRKERLLFKMQARAARNADAVITVSRYSKNDIVRYMGIHPDKVFAIYNGISPVYKPAPDVSDIREKYGLPERFLMYTGAMDYRKNPLGLLRIYKKYIELSNDPLPLVFVGKREYFRAVEVYWRDIGLGLKNARLLFTGFVDEIDLPGIYSAASALVFPSLYEGFGLPLIEAMACGTPVIAYSNSSVSEIVGDYGVLVNNNDEGEFAERLSELISDGRQYRKYVDRGLTRAGYFSWDNVADETLEVYKKVLG